MSIKFKHRLEYGIFKSLFLMTRLMPRKVLLAVGRALGSFVWKVVGFRRQVILENLDFAFGQEKDQAWIQQTALDFYRNLGMTLMEFLASGHRSKQNLLDDVQIRGREYLDEALSSGLGCLVVSGHFGNFELLLPRASAEGIRAHGIVKAQSNQLIDKFHNSLRARDGVGIIYTGGSFPRILAALDKGDLVGLLGDQDAGSKGQFVNFLGRPASVNRGPASLAVKSGCSLFTVFLYRQPDHSHILEIDPPLVRDPDWDDETAITRLTELHTARLEAAVRRAPAMYYWVHRRWKTQPKPKGKNQ